MVLIEIIRSILVKAPEYEEAETRKNIEAKG